MYPSINLDCAGSLELERATHAFRTANFPLLDDGEQELVHAIVTDQGMGGWLPVELFSPTMYDLGNLEPLAAYGNLKETWEAHSRAVLQRNLGPDGERAIDIILGEAMIMASEKHKARYVITAGRIIVDSEVEHRTLLALWDDGHKLSVNKIESQMIDDVRAAFSASSILRNATRLFAGKVSVLSGNNRLDFAYQDDEYVYSRSSTEGIEGNLFVAELPHIKD